ncbi:hypothetical protein BC826DRAFT_545285 [Russula brevipes]|nr:hypothetical protein BC826DRAFT_545285 [Russula brevipes]
MMSCMMALSSSDGLAVFLSFALTDKYPLSLFIVGSTARGKYRLPTHTNTAVLKRASMLEEGGSRAVEGMGMVSVVGSCEWKEAGVLVVHSPTAGGLETHNDE